ncbi:hypothetical protein ACLB1M_23320 [Escherichia coli]
MLRVAGYLYVTWMLKKGCSRIVWGSGQNDSCVIHYNVVPERMPGEMLFRKTIM